MHAVLVRERAAVYAAPVAGLPFNSTTVREYLKATYGRAPARSTLHYWLKHNMVPGAQLISARNYYIPRSAVPAIIELMDRQERRKESRS